MLLFEQGRYDHAETEARRVLTLDPDDAHAHALLGLCLLRKEDWPGALREVDEAVRLAPLTPYVHYVAGHVMLAAHRHDAAMREATAAVQLDPNEPAHHALIAKIHLDLRRWPQALEAAEAGLALDPEHVECNNVRGMALVKLGRRGEAEAALRDTLALDPEDAFTHANRGWSLLHERKPKEAMEHFREALRIDPTLDWARAGIVEALKARNFVYRWMLAYFLFMSRLSSQAQWGIVLGGFFGYQLVGNVARSNPGLKPFLQPLIVAYVVFAVLTWLAYPLFNLLLRVSKMGRLALSAEQVRAANWIGGTLLLALVCLGLHFATGALVFFDAAMMVGLLTLPLSGTFAVPNGWPRWVMAGVVAALVALAATHLFRMAQIGGMASVMPEEAWRANQLVGVYARCILGATILYNFLAQVKVKKG
jgi:tetratricopeptide (TPR) repeat protein